MMSEKLPFILSPTFENSLEDNSQERREVVPRSKIGNSSDDDSEPIKRKNKPRHFSDSERDEGSKNIDDNVIVRSKPEKCVYYDNSSIQITTKKSRIKRNDVSDSDSNSSTKNVIRKQKKYKSIRTENKKEKLKAKFNNLQQKTQIHSDEKLPIIDNESSKNSDDVSCLKIKQKIKKSAYSMKSICEPDTSEEEDIKTVDHQKYKSQKAKSMKLTSPKSMRMSAKQAMENMHKIKSESNRMLREKQVSLPYHRPKALSLKDIMSRRKPAVTSDGKTLPIKMNNEQLKQYVLLLEQRQKEVIELCKSDTEEEDHCSEEVINVKNDIVMDITENDVTQPSLEATKIGQNVKGNSETSCIECDDQENVITYCQHLLEKQTCSSMETETVNESVILHEKCSEKDVNNKLVSEEEVIHTKELSENQSVKTSGQISEQESQIMELHYESEKIESIMEDEHSISKENISELHSNSIEDHHTEAQQNDEDSINNEFNYDDLDKLIENAEIIYDEVKNKELDDKFLVTKNVEIFSNPKLTGTPGMLINLDNDDPSIPKQLTGVDLLKERFTYFAKLKSLQDMERDREKKFKPGTQHLKLKQELEQQIAEQRSLEWEKRLEEENRLKTEINGHNSYDDIEKLDAMLDNNTEKLDDDKVENDSSESEEEPIENDVILEDKPKKRNSMVDDEAEESECDECIAGDDNDDVELSNCEKNDSEDTDLEDEDDDDETNDSSSESEEEIETKLKKGRILKAFEDSDDECAGVESTIQVNCEIIDNKVDTVPDKYNEATKDTQDEELQLAQVNKSSDDLYSSRELAKPDLIFSDLNKNSEENTSIDLGTQTFSILDSAKPNQNVYLNSPEKLPICGNQVQDDVNLNLTVGMCPDNFSHDLITKDTPPPLAQTQKIGDDVIALCTGKFYDNPFVSQDEKLSGYSQTQEIGADVAALCTGKFYDNPFLSQYDEYSEISKPEALDTIEKPKEDNIMNMENKQTESSNNDEKLINNLRNVEKAVLNSILDELDGPDFEEPQNECFVSNEQSRDKASSQKNQTKRKLVIDSDDETNDALQKKNKRLKKRKTKQRALQISDDEEEEEEDLLEENHEAGSDTEENEERVVEYDSEENEVEVQSKSIKKKRVGAFFENEAELTSEDEWVGSGDEDERGLDRMEREEGDNDTFHQGKLQRELGQIHMREVLDQDKREVRILQELLFEDGDLGDGHRQRKFRWKNADGEEETGTNPDKFADTQEEEFESEEQWRKQRHEREMFLRKLQEKDEPILDTNINRNSLIKANLNSRSTSKPESSKIEKEDTPVVVKKSTKDIPSPTKPFRIFQQNYHGSLLTRGRGALARLAALAAPLAADDDDAPKIVTSTNRRNFVFTALSQDVQPKVNKRKAETDVNTPRLIKKIKTDEAKKRYKSTLFDLLKT